MCRIVFRLLAGMLALGFLAFALPAAVIQAVHGHASYWLPVLGTLYFIYMMGTYAKSGTPFHWSADYPFIPFPEIGPVEPDMPYTDPVFGALRAAHGSSDARMSIELVSGCPVWDDEELDQFMLACLRTRCGRHQDPLLHRHYLITGTRYPGVDYRRCKDSWNQIAAACPTWPGLRSDRTTPVLKETVEQAIAAAVAALEGPGQAPISRSTAGLSGP